MALDPAKEVPAERTPVSPGELRLILCRGHEQAFAGEVPSDNRLGVAWAQVNLETGRTKAAWRFNWGNVIATSAWPGKWQQLPGLPASEPQFYRAYDTGEAGAADYWRVVARMNTKRSGAILQAFDAGDPERAAEELRAAGYFTAPLSGYQRTMRALFDEYRVKFGGGGAPGRILVAGIVAVIAAAGAWWLAR